MTNQVNADSLKDTGVIIDSTVNVGASLNEKAVEQIVGDLDAKKSANEQGTKLERFVEDGILAGSILIAAAEDLVNKIPDNVKKSARDNVTEATSAVKYSSVVAADKTVDAYKNLIPDPAKKLLTKGADLVGKGVDLLVEEAKSNAQVTSDIGSKIWNNATDSFGELANNAASSVEKASIAHDKTANKVGATAMKPVHLPVALALQMAGSAVEMVGKIAESMHFKKETPLANKWNKTMIGAGVAVDQGSTALGGKIASKGLISTGAIIGVAGTALGLALFAPEKIKQKGTGMKDKAIMLATFVPKGKELDSGDKEQLKNVVEGASKVAKEMGIGQEASPARA